MTDGDIPGDDRGFLLGDGLFETLLADHGRLVWFKAHAARLTAGCAALGLPAPSLAKLRAVAEAAIARVELDDRRAAVRLTWSAGSGGRGLDRPDQIAPRLLASAAPAPLAAAPMRLATSAVRRNAGSPASRLKTLAYLDNVLARREARAVGADEALMLNTDGFLACAAAANLFWITEGRLFTPALDCGVLEGIARGELFRLGAALGLEVAEVRATPSALTASEAVFVTNSLIGLRPVTTLDGLAWGPHPLVTLLGDRIAASMGSI